MSHKQAEHHPDLQPEPPQVQPGSFVSQTPSQTCESASHETAVQPSQVEPKGPTYLSISLAALLSSSMGSKFDPYQAAMSENVLAEINNMVRNLRVEVIYVVYLNVVTVSLQEPLQQPEQSQQPQQAGPSPWPDLYELNAKPFLSPVQSPSTAQVPLLGTQPVGTAPPSQLPLQPVGMPQPVGTSLHSQLPLQLVGMPQPVSTSLHSQLPLQPVGMPQPVGTSLHSQLPLQPVGMPQPVGTSLHSQLPLQPVGMPQPVSTSPHSKPPLQPVGMPQPVGTSLHSQLPLQAAELPQSSQQPLALASTLTFKDPGTGPQQDYAAKATKFLTRVQQVLRIEDIRTELTQGNYKEKMHKLLCWEEKAHIEILGEK